MYFHYNYIKEKYPNEAELIYTDTHSLMYHIKSDDFYADIRNDVKKWYDTSELPVGHPSSRCEQEGAGDDERRNKGKNNKRGCCSESEIIFNQDVRRSEGK